MSKIRKIGKAHETEDILNYLKELPIDEMMVVFRIRDPETGQLQWFYEHTGMESKFNMAGVLHWVQDELVYME